MEAVPDPFGQALARRIFQTRYVVEITMVQRVEHRRERSGKIGEIEQPPGSGIGFATQPYLDAKRMTVQTRALVAGRHVGQAMRGFDLEDLVDQGGHDGRRIPVGGMNFAWFRSMITAGA